MRISSVASPLNRLVTMVVMAALAPQWARADVAHWDAPALDRWFHQGDSAPGFKDLMSTFSNYEPGAGFTQARPGSFILGFDTSDQIPLVASQRYQINSIRVTLDYVDEDRAVAYDPTIDSLHDILSGTDDPGKPVELFGIGYANGYERLGFGANDSQPPEFEESSPLWPLGVPTLEQTFNVFPLGDDGTGTFGNVFNSPGGEGVFEYNPVTEEYDLLVEVTKLAWDTTPWAVGTVDGLAPGERIPPLSVFQFDVNLALPGVLEYFQQNLSIGQVGVFIASLHDLTGFHEGGNAAYPTFHSKESLWVDFGLASAPTLEIDYAILADTLPGDFDGDGDVDGRDFLVWQRGGSPVPLSTDDLNAWQTNYGIGEPSPPPASTLVIPEPTSLAIVIVGIITGLNLRVSRRAVR